jgi:hypothetical protein
MHTLPSYALSYQRRSGLITWDRDALSSCVLDQEVSLILHAVALLEEDTAISSHQARSLGIDRAADIAAFLPTWEQEEAEHARALRFLLEKQSCSAPPARPRLASFRRRCIARVPGSVLDNLPQPAFVFCVLGAAAEYVAIVTYTELAKRVDHPAAAALLRSIARQEGQHFAFFLAAAKGRGEAMSTRSGRVSRRVLASVWEPPGVPSLGLAAWRTTFAPLLNSADFCARSLMMDRIVDSVPHLDGLHLMATFLREDERTAEGQMS